MSINLLERDAQLRSCPSACGVGPYLTGGHMDNPYWLPGLLAFLGAAVGPLVYDFLKKWLLPSPERRALRRLLKIFRPLDAIAGAFPRYEHQLLNLWQYIEDPNPEKGTYQARLAEHEQTGRRIVRAAERIERELRGGGLGLAMHAPELLESLRELTADIRRQYGRNAYELQSFTGDARSSQGLAAAAEKYWNECRTTGTEVRRVYQSFATQLSTNYNLLALLSQ